jgi:hypothetical protein
MNFSTNRFQIIIYILNVLMKYELKFEINVIFPFSAKGAIFD